MVAIIIDGKQMMVDDNLTILQAARNANIDIPTLCYLDGLNEIGACRLCVVEVVGMNRLVASCNTKVQEGMVVATNTEKVWATRKLNTELILSQHDCRCAKCSRSGNCVLQKIANDFGLLSNCVLQNIVTDTGTLKVSYTKKLKTVKWNENFPLIRDEKRCVQCMRCIQVCQKIQGIGVWDIVNTGSRTAVAVAGNGNIETSDCTMCGQCITHCPVGALWARDDHKKAFSVIADPEKTTIVQISPAVRAAWGESLGLTSEQATDKRLAAVLRQIGFDYVCKTDIGTDFMVMELSTKLLEKWNYKERNDFPLFTSNCPSWIHFIKSQYPDLLKYVSTIKSPQQILGTITRQYYSELLDIDADKICCVSISPCVADKYENYITAGNQADTKTNIDISLTTNELTRMIKTANIKVSQLPEEDFDQPFNIGTGAAVMTGAAGGTIEATLRTFYYLLTGKNPAPDTLAAAHGNTSLQEINFDIEGNILRTATASGLSNARKLIEMILSGKAQYDFVEVMACPGGCTGGGGQPIHEGCECYDNRNEILYTFDSINPLHFSHQSPTVQTLYQRYLSQPLSEKTCHILHTEYNQ